MQLHLEELTDGANPEHWTAGLLAAQEHTGLPERIDAQAQIDVQRMPGMSETQRPRQDQPVAPMDNPDVPDPRLSLDKKSEFPFALPEHQHFALAGFHERAPDFEFHSTRKPATRKYRVPALTDEKAPAVSIETWSSASCLTMHDSNLCMNCHDHYGHRMRRDYRESNNLASIHARRLGCPASFPALRPAWNPAGYRCVRPVVRPNDRSIAPLAWSRWKRLTY